MSPWFSRVTDFTPTIRQLYAANVSTDCDGLHLKGTYLLFAYEDL